MGPKKDQDQYWYCKKYATNPQNLLKNKLFRTGCKIFMYGVQKMRYIYLISNKQPSENKMKNITKGQHVEVIANNEICKGVVTMIETLNNGSKNYKVELRDSSDVVYCGAREIL